MPSRSTAPACGKRHGAEEPPFDVTLSPDDQHRTTDRSCCAPEITRRFGSREAVGSRRGSACPPGPFFHTVSVRADRRSMALVAAQETHRAGERAANEIRLIARGAHEAATRRIVAWAPPSTPSRASKRRLPDRPCRRSAAATNPRTAPSIRARDRRHHGRSGLREARARDRAPGEVF